MHLKAELTGPFGAFGAGSRSDASVVSDVDTGLSQSMKLPAPAACDAVGELSRARPNDISDRWFTDRGAKATGTGTDCRSGSKDP